MKDITEIERLIQDYYGSFHNKDWKEFSEYLSAEFKYFTDNLGVSDKGKFLDFLSRDTWQGKDYKINDINIHVSENKDMAFAAYKTSFTGTDKGKEMTVNAIETSIFIKENGMWKILHSHTSNKVTK